MEVKIEKVQANFKFMVFFILMMVTFLCISISLNNPVSLTLVIIFGVLSLYYFLKYNNEKIVISDNGIKYSNIFGNKKEFDFSELSIMKVKEHYQINTSSKSFYFRKYEIKNEYIFFDKEKKLFKLVSNEFKGNSKEIIDLAMKQNRLKIKKEDLDGEDVLKVKNNPTSLISNLFMFIFMLLIILAIFVGLSYDFEYEIFIFLCLFVAIDVYYFVCTVSDMMQALQKVYYIENQGFYKIRFGNKEYYDFKEVDNYITKKYWCIEPVEYKLNLYKDNKKILVLKNNNIGFYNFLDEVRNNVI